MVEDLVMRGADDWVDAAEVAWVAKSIGQAVDDASIRELSIEVIRHVLDEGLMTIGDVSFDGFSMWELPTDEAIEKVERVWRGLGRAPNLGDVCWLENTETGTLFAERLFEQRDERGE